MFLHFVPKCAANLQLTNYPYVLISLWPVTNRSLLVLAHIQFFVSKNSLDETIYRKQWVSFFTLQIYVQICCTPYCLLPASETDSCIIDVLEDPSSSFYHSLTRNTCFHWVSGKSPLYTTRMLDIRPLMDMNNGFHNHFHAKENPWPSSKMLLRRMVIFCCWCRE